MNEKQKTFSKLMDEMEEHYPQKITKTALEVGKLLNGLSVNESETVIRLVTERIGEMAILEME